MIDPTRVNELQHRILIALAIGVENDGEALAILVSCILTMMVLAKVEKKDFLRVMGESWNVFMKMGKEDLEKAATLAEISRRVH